MPVVENDLLEFSTCATIIRPPITPEECTNFPTFEELVAAEEAADMGCTIRSALGWAIRTKALIETDCEAV